MIHSSFASPDEESPSEASSAPDSSALAQVRAKLQQIAACADAMLRRRDPRDVELAVAQIKSDCDAVLSLVENSLVVDGNPQAAKAGSASSKRASAKSVTKSAVAVATNSDQRASGPKKGHVLLVEDDQDLQVFGQLLLANHGYEVLLAGTSQEAMQLVSDRVDLVLMDLRLPDTDGDATARRMRARGYSGAIVAMSGDSPSWDDLKAAGFDAYVSKLAPLEEIVQVCHNEVESRRRPTVAETQAAAEKFAALRQSYAEKLPRVAVMLRQCFTSDDRKQLVSIAHRLNGTCALYGMAEIGSSAQRLKQAVEQCKATTEIETHLADLEGRIKHLRV